MKMDWRDRPTAKELLEDEWFMEEAGDKGMTVTGCDLQSLQTGIDQPLP